MDDTTDKYRYIVCGYIRSLQNLLTFNIEFDLISHLILIYYFPIQYKWDMFDNELWEIVDYKSSQKILRGNTNYAVPYEGTKFRINHSFGTMVFPIRSNTFNTNSENNNDDDSSIKTWSVKALTTYYDRHHSIGITTNREITKKWSGQYSYYDGRYGSEPNCKGYWRSNETVTVSLNCNNWRATYYKTDRRKNYEVIKLKQESVRPNKVYHFALYIHPDAAYCGHSQYQIVDSPTI